MSEHSKQYGQDSRALDNSHPHHRMIVVRFYQQHPELGKPSELQTYDSWNEVPNQPTLSSATYVFVDGGIRTRPLDLGSAVLINDGGFIEAPIACGLFHKSGGVINARVTQRLQSQVVDGNTPPRLLP